MSKNTKKPRKDYVSIIVPAHNAEEHIEKCILSLVKQTYDNIEIIVVDDDSGDHTKDIVSQIHDYRLHYMQVKHHNAALTRHEGVHRSTGEYVCFVDADDFVVDTYVEVLRSALKASKADISSARIVSYADEEDLVSSQSQMKMRVETNTLKYFSENYHVESRRRHIAQSMVAKLFPRGILEGLDYSEIKTTVLEDNIIMSQILSGVKHGVVLCDADIYYYRENPNSTMNNALKSQIEYDGRQIGYPELFDITMRYVARQFSEFDRCDYYVEKLRADEYYQLSRQLPSALGQLEERQREIEALEEGVKRERAATQEQAQKIAEIQNSVSYRVGRAIATPLRIIRELKK